MYQLIRPPIMTVTEQRSHAPELLDQLNDEFFAAVYSMLETYVRQQQEPIIGYKVGTGEPISAKEADEVFEAVVEDVKAGNYTEIDDLIAQRSAKW